MGQNGQPGTGGHAYVEISPAKVGLHLTQASSTGSGSTRSASSATSGNPVLHRVNQIAVQIAVPRDRNATEADPFTRQHGAVPAGGGAVPDRLGRFLRRLAPGGGCTTVRSE